LPLLSLALRCQPAPRPLGEAVITTGAAIAAFRLAWVAYWLLEQRW
jgi:hypothetical protein